MDKPYTALMQSWNQLWQSGYEPIWEIYRQWTYSTEAYRLGQAQVGQTPAEEVWRHGRIRLIRYIPTTPRQYPIPVLGVPSLINRYTILDLMPDRSLVGYLVSQGYRVYMLDWGRPEPEDARTTFDEIITGYLRQAVGAVGDDAGVEKVSLLGYCMGGTFSAIYSSLYGSQVANLVNLAGPISFHDQGIFSLITRADWFNADQLVDTYGNIPADLLSWAFQMLRPTSHLVRALFLYERMGDSDFVRSFAAMQTWIFDQVDFPGEAFRRYIKALYQENQLVKDQFIINGRLVNLSNIHCPLLTITSPQDETAPCGSVSLLNDLVSSADKELLVLKGPHVGMVAGSSAPKLFWPALAEWLEPRSGSAS